jgi:hypothetical protein
MPGSIPTKAAFLPLVLVFALLMGGCSSQPNPALNLGGIDIEEVFNGQIKRIHQIMGSVRSMDTVEKALPELQAVSMNLDDLIFNSEKLSEEGQTHLSMLALKAVPQIEELVSQIKGSPATRDVLGGTMEEILGKLKQMI